MAKNLIDGEIVVHENTNLSTSNAQCIGCNRFEKEVMISLIENEDSQFVDIFMTQEQAKHLLVKLQKTIEENESILNC